MAESIITLGIGATPVSLTPFITSGLLIGAAVATTTITATVITRSGATTAVTRTGATTAVTNTGTITVKDGGTHG